MPDAPDNLEDHLGPRRVIVSDSSRVPMSLLLSALDLARERGVESLSEAHLVCAALQSGTLVHLLEDLGVPVATVYGRLEQEMSLEPPPGQQVVVRPDGGREVSWYGLVEVIQGRAAVLAATPNRHAPDSVDVFVGALFDASTLTTFATVMMANVDRDGLLEGISSSLDRYRSVSFPSTRVATLRPPVSVPWNKRERVVEVLGGSVPDGTHWTYTRRGEDMLVMAETAAVLDILTAEGILS